MIRYVGVPTDAVLRRFTPPGTTAATKVAAGWCRRLPPVSARIPRRRQLGPHVPHAGVVISLEVGRAVAK